MSASWNFAKKLLGATLRTCGYLGYGACVIHCLTEYVGDVVICQGPSMEPTLFSHDIILTEHLSLLRKTMHRGDIIIARSPSNPREFICKRIKALPGDKVRRGFTMTVVPQGYVWLEGDNKYNSTDSKNYGPVPLGLIRSRAVYRIFPFEKARKFTNS